MDKAQQILYHLDELYTEQADEERIMKACEINPAKYGAWRDAFEDYELSDVLLAIDEYWEYKSNKARPTIAQIKAKLNAHRAERIQTEQVQEDNPAKCIDFAWVQMNTDIENGNCRNNLYIYRDAERIVLEDWLKSEIPPEVHRKMSYASKIKVATDKGLFNNFDKAMVQAAQNRFGRDYEFQSANELKANGSVQKEGGFIVPQERGGGFKPLADSFRS